MGRLVHTGLGSLSLVAHVLHYPPSPHANSFVIGTAAINTHTQHTHCSLHTQVRDGQTSPHMPRLVELSWYLIAHVLHCPPPPPALSFIMSPAVINTHTVQPCLSSATPRSTASLNTRAVLSRVLPRYRLYSRHRDIDGISTVPIPVCLLDAHIRYCSNKHTHFEVIFQKTKEER